jgi:hypothetical protein
MEMAELPQLPPLAAHLWAWFFDLRATGGSTGFGPARLTRHEIRIWEEDEGIALEAWERRAILSIDAAWVASAQKQAEKPKGP